MSITGNANCRNTIRGTINKLATLHGYSAYEIAIINGFEGTEKEWLASLKGEGGHTPERNVDYWTDEDKAEIVNEVLAAIDGDEVSY
jgi:hypothetical protein